jgi:hypothetical protein
MDGRGPTAIAARSAMPTLSGVDLVLAIIGASIASWFAWELYAAYRRRPRLHAEVWTAAFVAYAGATWALVFGLGFGWTSFSFRSFYYLGAIANISLLAAGSIALANERVGRGVLRVVSLWLVFGFFATFLASFANPLPETGIPHGSEIFDFTFSIDALTLPGPRVFAAVSGSVGSVVVIALALVTAVRVRTSNRALAGGNLLIVAGTLAPAIGGSLTAIGESSSLALSLAVGITLLWFGYRIASAARSGERGAPVAQPSEDRRIPG